MMTPLERLLWRAVVLGLCLGEFLLTGSLLSALLTPPPPAGRG